MVPPAHDPDAAAPRASWRDRLRLILGLDGAGIVVLVTGAHDAAAPELISLLLEAPEGAPSRALRVVFDAPEMLDLPEGARVVLVEPGQHARWLNLHRPVVRERRLTVLLWCGRSCVEALKRGAPDFIDWISHRIEIPPMEPRYVIEAIHACEREGGALGVSHAPPALPAWRVVSALSPYAEIREACRQGPVWAKEVGDALSWLGVRVAHTEAGARHGLILADPQVLGAEDAWLDARPVPWGEAARRLEERGVAEPGVQAALMGLDPRAVGVERAGPVRLTTDPSWDTLIAMAREAPSAASIRLASELELVSLAETWLTEAVETPSVAAEALRMRARRALRSGDGDVALATLKEAIDRAQGDELETARCRRDLARVLVLRGDLDEAMRLLQAQLPIYERLGNARERARTMGKIADILHARGQLDDALRIREEEELPIYEYLGDARERAITMRRIADILHDRGHLDDALYIYRKKALPMFERLGDVRSRAITMGKIADILHDRGQLDDALRIREEEELPVYERLGDVRERAVAMGKMADILHDRGQLDEALRIRNEEQLPVYERLGDVRERAVTMGQIAAILQARGQLDEALRIRNEEELPVYERLGDVRSLIVARVNVALALLLRRRPEDAPEIVRLLVESLAAARTHGFTADATQITTIMEQMGLPIPADP